MIGISCVILPKNYRFPKQDLAGALAYVEDTQKEDAAVAAVGLAAYPYQKHYQRNWPQVEGHDDLRNAMAGAPEAWVLVIFPHPTERTMPEVQEILEEQFGVARNFPGTLGDGHAIVYSTTSKKENARP